MLLIVWAAGVALLSCVAWMGWLPQDDGLLAHTAERVLQGELPHRDFDAMYTGGLELLHALAFKLFGIRLASLRLMMLLVASVFVPVFYWLVARVLSPLWAGVVTAGALVWSLPVYFASMPSWHILFLSTFGIASLFKYFDTGHRRWLVATGVLAGLAVLMKVNGLLFAVAAVLSLVFAEQAETAPGAPKRLAIPSLLIWVGCGGLALGLLGIVVRHPGVMELFHYAVPGVAIAMVLALVEWRYGTSENRVARWWNLLAPFFLGLAIPILLFLIPYVRSGSMGALLHGLFVLPLRRITQATQLFRSGWTLFYGVPLALLLAFGARIPAGRVRLVAAGLAVLLLPLVVFGNVPGVYEAVCHAVRTIIPVAVVAGSVRLLNSAEIPSSRRRELFVVISTAAFVSLLQYPFPAYIYFCYVLPLGVLALVYVVTSMPSAPKPLFATLACFFVLFGALWIAPSSPAFVGKSPKHERDVPLELPRAGIEVQEPFAFYRELIEEVQKHAPEGEPIYAAPDSPEVYFLANRRNPTRTMYDVFDEDADRPERTARILQTLREQHVSTVVLRDSPPFSRPIRKSFYEALHQEYPRQQQVGIFLVMWKP